MRVLLSLIGVAAALQINGIEQRDMMEEMEHILVDNGGTNSDGLVNAITPCSNFATGNRNQGEQTTAEWVRIVFHEYVHFILRHSIHRP